MMPRKLASKERLASDLMHAPLFYSYLIVKKFAKWLFSNKD